ncbi:MAG: hypothetical protein QOJ58_5018 [Alphaproteobacteria bacterium]|nr:hypothetical protein [Alphaproteobacteria bacterium]
MVAKAEDVHDLFGKGCAAAKSIRKPMLYPLSYEGLRCTFTQDVRLVAGRRARAGYLAPGGSCRTCAACRRPASDHHPPPRGADCTARGGGSSRRSAPAVVCLSAFNDLITSDPTLPSRIRLPRRSSY